MRALVASGAKVTLCASNPLSTQDDTAASLVRDFGIDVHAIAGEDADTYNKHIDAVVATDPQIIMDDGADLDTALHTRFTDKLAGVIGGTEETTTGVVRLAAMAAEGTLGYPVFNINDANTKHCFDNHYGTGQSTLDGIVRATNRLLCGRTIVISGYGYCGSGLALRAKGMGMDVIVCEVDPLKALEAHMEGYRVMPAAEAARFADVWVTVTGDCKVVDAPAFENMKDGAINSEAKAATSTPKSTSIGSRSTPPPKSSSSLLSRNTHSKTGARSCCSPKGVSSTSLVPKAIRPA